MVADPSADCGQGVFFLDKLQGFPVFALSSQSHIPLDRNVSGAGRFTWRSASLFDRKGARYGLGVPAEGSTALIQLHIVFVIALNRTDPGAFAAAGAFGNIYETRLLKELHLEISRFTGNFLNFRKGEKLDVEMPADLDQLGRDNSHRAVVGGEGLVELRHDTADRRLFFDQIDVIAGIGKIES
jgi:hypothetical protein